MANVADNHRLGRGQILGDDDLTVPRVALLGVTERGQYAHAQRPELTSIDLVGLRRVVASYLYPLSLSNFVLALSVYAPETGKVGTTVLRDDAGAEVFRVDLTFEGPERLEELVEREPPNRHSGLIVLADRGRAWHTFLVPLGDQLLDRPKRLDVFLVTPQGEVGLGQLQFALAQVPPLSADRLAAIKSDPRAAKGLRMDLGCKHCPTKLKVFASLERPQNPDPQLVWYEDLPDVFECSCGQTKLPLDSIRCNAHALLGRTDVNPSNVNFTQEYERHALEQISQDFYDLLERETKEEDVQRFLSRNPILFHFLAPERLFNKPPILSKYKADFAALDARKTLTLVEIERPGILLLRKDGAASADVEHAISQVRDWFFELDQHRSAVLAGLGLKDDDVTQVRGLVVAGRDKSASPAALRKFRWQDRGPIDVMTYDDLHGMFSTLGRGFRRL